MSPLNLVAIEIVGAVLMAIAILVAGTLRRALQTGVLKKNIRYFQAGYWHRKKNPVAFRLMCSIGAVSAIAGFSMGAFLSISGIAIFLGYWK